MGMMIGRKNMGLQRDTVEGVRRIGCWERIRLILALYTGNAQKGREEIGDGDSYT